jgi:hypothetical protein
MNAELFKKGEQSEEVQETIVPHFQFLKAQTGDSRHDTHDEQFLLHRVRRTYTRTGYVLDRIIERRLQIFSVLLPISERSRRPEIPHFPVNFGHNEPEPWLTCLKREQSRKNMPVCSTNFGRRRKTSAGYLQGCK